MADQPTDWIKDAGWISELRKVAREGTAFEHETMLRRFASAQAEQIAQQKTGLWKPIFAIDAMCRREIEGYEKHLRVTARSAPDHRPCESGARAKFAEQVLGLLARAAAPAGEQHG